MSTCACTLRKRPMLVAALNADRPHRSTRQAFGLRHLAQARLTAPPIAQLAVVLGPCNNIILAPTLAKIRIAVTSQKITTPIPLGLAAPVAGKGIQLQIAQEVIHQTLWLYIL